MTTIQPAAGWRGGQGAAGVRTGRMRGEGAGVGGEGRPAPWESGGTMSRSSCAVLYLGRGEVLGREPQTGDEGGASRGAKASSALRVLPPSLRASPPRHAALRPHLLPRGPEPRPLPAHPRQGCQGANKSVLATSPEVPSPHRTLTAISLIIGVAKCQFVPRRPALTRGAWLRGRGGGASLIVVLSMPEQAVVVSGEKQTS